MASGRLGRCIIGGRTGAEVYVNSSGKDVSVTLFSQALSTITNTELTTVIGVAATTLGSTVIIANSGTVGTYQSTTAFNFSCAYCRCGSGMEYPSPSIGATMQGAYRTWRNCCSFASDYSGSYPVRGPSFISTEGNITDIDQTFRTCMCSNCCVPIVYGGNEIQNPAIWIDAQEPRMCFDATHGPMYQSNVVGWYPQSWDGGNRCKRCCWPQLSTFITQRHIGVGVTAAQRAAQFMANPMCNCGVNDTWFMPNGGTNNTFPFVRWDGCDSHMGCCCMGGSHCSIQGCKLCYHAGYEGRYLFTLFNYYALCNTPAWTGRTWNNGVRCCITAVNCGDRNTCFDCGAGGCGWPSISQQGPYKIDCGKYGSPMWWSVQWCGDSPHTCCQWGRISQGNGYNVSMHCNTGCCGYVCWAENADKRLCEPGCHTNARHLFYTFCGWTCKYQCSCGCYMKNEPTNTKRMSPYGYLMGMTNCFFMAFYAHGTDTQCYNFGFNDICLWGGCCCQYGPCMYNSYYTFKIPVQALSPASDEFAVKYAAWNPFTCLVYVAIRSSSANDCGIFQIETHEVRRNMGMFCGCSGQPCFCCGNLCTHHSNPPGASDWGTVFSADGGIGAKALCRVATWPACWALPKYSSGGMCVSCLYRSEKCLWTMGLYNHDTKKWDGYTSNNLWQWTLASDPLVQEVNTTLTRTITDDYQCVIDTCNCFYANMDCSGLIDFRVKTNQYERTGLVLSNGDRIMVNNDGTPKINVQVWGYEG